MAENPAAWTMMNNTGAPSDLVVAAKEGTPAGKLAGALNYAEGVGQLASIMKTAKQMAKETTARNNAVGTTASASSPGAAFKADTQHKYQIHFSSTTSDPDFPMVSVTGFLPEDISVDISSDYTPAFGEGLFDPSAGLMQKAIRLAGYSGITQEMSVKIWESTAGIVLSVPITFVAGDIIGGRVVTNVIDPILDLMSLCAPSRGENDWFLTPPGPNVVADLDKVITLAKDVAVLLGEGLVDGAAVVAGALPTGTLVTAVANKIPGVDLSTTSENIGSMITNLKANAAKIDTKGLLKFDHTIRVYIGDFLYFDNVVVDSVSQNYKMILDSQGNPMQATVNVQFTTMLSPTIQDLRKIFVHHSKKKG